MLTIILDIEKDGSFDFREFSVIDDSLNLENEKIKGYNTYFIALEETGKLRKLVTLRNERTEICLEVHSAIPGISTRD